MKEKLLQFKSVLLMECLLRFRRSSTPILILVLCGAAFLLMPEVGSGGVMFLIGDHRVLLNSAATSLTSAVMGGLVFSLAGFYFISNSVERDLQSGVGKLVAATPLSSFRYLAGKLAGNIIYLAAVAAVFMIACMAMHLLRGERPLEPLVFIQTFGIMFLPAIPSIAAIALMFECVPFFSGRGGDLAYFFFWTLTLALPPAFVSASHGHAWILAADYAGLGFFVRQIIEVTGATNFTIGYAPYNASLSPLLFSGLRWIPGLVIPRLLSVVITVPCFVIAWAAFRRFDPAVNRSGERAKVGRTIRLWQGFNTAAVRLTVPRGGWLVGSPSTVKAVALDVRLTLALHPVFFLLSVLSFIFGLVAPIETIRVSVFPLLFLILVPLLASISTRDRIGNTTRLIFSAPSMREKFVFVKLLSSFSAAIFLACAPLARIGMDDPLGFVAALNGLLFIASAATFFGLLTGTPKTFMVLFLLFLYVAVSSKDIPALDFAGLEKIVTPSIMLSYLGASVFMAATALGFQRWRLQRGDS